MNNNVKNAVEAMSGEFPCMPIPEIRDKNYKFDSETRNYVAKAGYNLKWLDTFKGGCWHIIR